jgi:hypothetical protein
MQNDELFESMSHIMDKMNEGAELSNEELTEFAKFMLRVTGRLIRDISQLKTLIMVKNSEERVH